MILYALVDDIKKHSHLKVHALLTFYILLSSHTSLVIYVSTIILTVKWKTLVFLLLYLT